jgi:hypothetical protein
MIKRYDVLCIGSATLDNFLTTDCSLKSVKLGDKVLVKKNRETFWWWWNKFCCSFIKIRIKSEIIIQVR